MRGLEQFPGFPTQTHATPVPEAFYAEVLPHLTRLAEVKVFLVALRRIRRQRGAIRLVTARELVSAPEIGALTEARDGDAAPHHDGDDGGPTDDREAIVRGVMAAFTEAGVFIGIPLSDDDAAYFLNDSEGRRAAERVRAGAAAVTPAPAPAHGERETAPQPGMIFRLYEDTIGPIPGAGIAEELAEAEREYPASWIQDAFQEAAAHNARRWAYVRAILRKWRDRGKGDGTTERRSAEDRYRGGKYGQVVRWR